MTHEVSMLSLKAAKLRVAGKLTGGKHPTIGFCEFQYCRSAVSSLRLTGSVDVASTERSTACVADTWCEDLRAGFHA